MNLSVHDLLKIFILSVRDIFGEVAPACRKHYLDKEAPASVYFR